VREISGDHPDSARAEVIDFIGITAQRNDLLAGGRQGINYC
jgi:hypothetical protein